MEREKRAAASQSFDTPRREGVVLGDGTLLAALMEIEEILEHRGWCQGAAPDRAGRLSLDAAVDRVAAHLSHSERERMLLRARLQNRLCRSCGAGALAAWNDAPGRRYTEVWELLQITRFVYAA